MSKHYDSARVVLLALALAAGCGGAPLALELPDMAPVACEGQPQIVSDSCKGLFTADGRQCATCAEHSACTFDDAAFNAVDLLHGYCVDRQLGCNDPHCQPR